MTTVAATAPQHGLLRILGVTSGVALSVGMVVGAGILRAPAAIAVEVPGVWFILALWIVGGLQAANSANVYAELGAAMPRTGGQYVFAQRIYGDVGGLVVGWADWIACIAAVAATSVSFAEFLPLVIPAAGAHKAAIAVALQIAIYATNVLGLREGRAIQVVTSTTKAVMLFAFVLAAILVVAPAESASAAPPAPVWTWSAAILGYQLIFSAYAGWGAPVYFSGENVAPGRSIPRALFFGIVIAALLYVGINAALLHALGQQGVAASPLPFLDVMKSLGGSFPALLFALVALVTVASGCNANAMAGPRVLYALGENGLLPRALARVNAGGSPTVAFLFTAAFSIALALTGGFALVFGLIAFANMSTAVLCETGFFILRRREPQLARPYRARLYPWLPALALLTDATVLGLIGYADRRGVLVIIGLAVLCVPLALIARRSRALALN